MTKGEQRTIEFRARAREALASAESAGLERVREQRRRSAATWTEMADAEEARARARAAGRPALRRHQKVEQMTSPTVDIVELENRTQATERLLSTLIAILSARDPHLLQQLQAVFARPDFATDEPGRAASATWSRIAAQLETTAGLVKGLGSPRG